MILCVEEAFNIIRDNLPSSTVLHAGVKHYICFQTLYVLLGLFSSTDQRLIEHDADFLYWSSHKIEAHDTSIKTPSCNAVKLGEIPPRLPQEY